MDHKISWLGWGWVGLTVLWCAEGKQKYTVFGLVCHKPADSFGVHVIKCGKGGEQIHLCTGRSCRHRTPRWTSPG